MTLASFLLKKQGPTDVIKERRRYPRYGVEWPVRFWLDDTVSVAGRVVDASLSGLRVALIDPTAPALTPSNYRVDVYPGSAKQFTCIADVRRSDARGIGMQLVFVPGSVLVVSADAEIRRALSPLLANTGYGVTEANGLEDGQEAGRDQTDVVLLDLPDPKLSATLRRLRQDDQCTSIVTIVPDGTLSAAREALRLGANHCLFKPINPDWLHEVTASAVVTTKYARADLVITAHRARHPSSF